MTLLRKTFGVALLLCVVCAVVVSSAAVMLRPTQQANKLLDLKTNILASAGLLSRASTLRPSLSRSRRVVVDLETGRFTDAVDAANLRSAQSVKRSSAVELTD